MNKADKNTENKNYGAQSIKVLKGLEAVKKRPGMYIGNTDDGTGLHHMVYEVTDNAVDESLAGYCDKIIITLHNDGSASVEDNGRGIPTDIHETEGVSAAQVIMTQLHAGGKFDQKSYQVSGGLHGVGVSVVNALSVWLELVIWRNGKLYFMRFKHGVPEADLKEISSLEEYETLGEKHEDIFVKAKAGKTGTYVRFLPDPNTFTDCTFHFNVLMKRYKELAFLNKNLKFILEDKKNNKEKTFFEEGGIKSFVTENAKNKELLFEDPFYCHARKEDVDVEVSLLWAKNSYDDNTICFTNTIPQRDGGTHLQGFRSGITRAVQKYLPESKMKGLTCTGEDIREGLYCVMSVKVPDPKFASQTKDKLVSSHVRSAVENAVVESLSRWLEENPHHTKAIAERIIESIKVREAARKARELTRKVKTADSSLQIASKLGDCSEKDPAKRELFIVEGQSAGGSAKQARNRANQAVLALQGKILNVEKSVLSKILQYEAIRTLISVLGTGIEENCKIEECRYHKIIIMTDADVDGSHIRTLLLTFLFRYMRPLFDAGFVYVSRPPLYGIKSKKHNTVYIRDDKELEEYIINATRKAIDINVNGETLSEEKKNDLYHLSFKAKRQLQYFGDLIEDFVQAGVFKKGLNADSAQMLQDFLNKKYKDAVVSINEDIWEIEYVEHAILKNFDINVSEISDDVLAILKDWPQTEMRIHTKTKKVDNIMRLYRMIEDVQASICDISRFKGLGEMNPKELKETGMFPDTRTIEQMKIDNSEEAHEVTKLLMGDEVLPRRQFIETNAWNANVDV